MDIPLLATQTYNKHLATQACITLLSLSLESLTTSVIPDKSFLAARGGYTGSVPTRPPKRKTSLSEKISLFSSSESFTESLKL